MTEREGVLFSTRSNFSWGTVSPCKFRVAFSHDLFTVKSPFYVLRGSEDADRLPILDNDPRRATVFWSR
jgi:hypothetical protein